MRMIGYTVQWLNALFDIRDDTAEEHWEDNGTAARWKPKVGWT